MDLEACVLKPSHRFFIHEENAVACIVVTTGKITLNPCLSLRGNQKERDEKNAKPNQNAMSYHG
jgi:hypothetical protein